MLHLIQELDERSYTERLGEHLIRRKADEADTSQRRISQII